MKQQTVFTPTEARQKFFTLLRLVEQGETAIIVKKSHNIVFEMKRQPAQSKKTKLAALKKLSQSGLRTTDWKTMKKIIEGRYAQHL